MIPLTPPTVHLNGTSKEELVTQLLDTIEAARALHEAMKKAAPNARDYYPQGTDAIKAAMDAWNERLVAVDVLMAEMEEQALRITLG